MTYDELRAAVNDEIARNARLAAIRERIEDGEADFLDSELYTAITAEITAEQMRRNVLALSDREPAFVGVVRERYTDTFNVFNAVQRILDAVTGIRIRTVQPGFENDRAHKIGHSLNDPTVPESVIERRAWSATENFVRSQHDRCTQVNASFRSRAGLDCRITRTGGAKCCDWCASVSGSFTTSSAPDGIWGRHDNCKCSITYETRRGSFQQLSGTGKGWDTVEELPDLPLHVLDGETVGAGDVHAVSAEQAAATEADKLHKMARGMVESERSKIKTDYPSTLVDRSMLASHQYRAQFDDIEENSQIARIVFQSSRNALLHRTGTVYEDLYFIDSTSGRSLRRTDYNVPKEVKPSKRMLRMVRDSEPYTIIAVHNHPSSGMPSMGDIHLAWERKYKYGVIACHNGSIVQYTVTGEFDNDFVDILLDKIEKLVYNKKNEKNNEKLQREISQTLALLKENNVEMKVIRWK